MSYKKLCLTLQYLKYIFFVVTCNMILCFRKNNNKSYFTLSVIIYRIDFGRLIDE